MVILERGIYRFLNGKELYIEEIQYSYNGVAHWEDKFQPFEHLDPSDPTNTLPAHKYRRVRHAGDTAFQYPEYIVAEDGDNSVLRKTDTYIQWKLSLEADTAWVDLVALEDITGEAGEKGDRGLGWNIDMAGFLDVRPACCGDTCQTTSSCNSCSQSGVNVSCTSTDNPIFLSLGNHMLVSDDVGDDTNRWHTTDGTTWVQSTAALIGIPVVGWGATLAANSNSSAYTCNNQGQVVGFHVLPSAYDSRGLTYICANGYWTPNVNVAVPTGEVKIDSSDVLGYLEDKLDAVTLDTDGDIVYVVDGSIDYAKLDVTVFGDGLRTTDSLIRVNPSAIVGFGLAVYVSDADSLPDLQVAVTDLIDDGLEIHDDNLNDVDGEDRIKIKVKVENLISTTSGLTYRLPTAGESVDLLNADLFIKPYHGILVTADGVTLDVDTAIFSLDGTTGLGLLADSIRSTHLHPDVAGIALSQGVSGQLDVGILATLFGVNGSNEIYVLGNAITGDLLNDNVADNDRGLAVINDMLAITVDEDYFTFNTSGNLTISTDIYDNILTNRAVKYIKVGSDLLRNGVTVQGNSDDPYVDISVSKITGVSGFEISASMDTTALESFVQSVVGSVMSLGISDISGLQTALDAKLDSTLGVTFDVRYGNMRVVKTGTFAGLQLTPDAGTTWYRLDITESAGEGYITVSLVS